VSDKRIHGLDKAGAGDAGAIEGGDVLGPCPSCGADLHVCQAENPRTGRVERAIMHPVPFCTYYGETDSEAIERAIKQAIERAIKQAREED
jgi:hypothetical protein